MASRFVLDVNKLPVVEVWTMVGRGGGRPAKPAKKLAKGHGKGTRRVAVSLRDETIEAIDARAAKHHRTRTQEIEHIVESAMQGETS